MPPRNKATTGPKKKGAPSQSGLVKPSRSPRKKTLSAKAAAGVQDGVKPAHLTSLPASRPVPSKAGTQDVEDQSEAEAATAEDDSDSEAEFFAPSKNVRKGGPKPISGGKRKVGASSDISDRSPPALPSSSPKKKKKGSSNSRLKTAPESDGSGGDALVPSPPVTPSRRLPSSARSSAKQKRISVVESDSEAALSPSVGGGRVDSSPNSADEDYDMAYVGLDEATQSDIDFIENDMEEGIDVDANNLSEGEASEDSEAESAVPEYAQDNASDEEGEDDGISGVASDLEGTLSEENSEVASVPPSSAPSSPRKRVRVQEVDSDIDYTPTRSVTSSSKKRSRVQEVVEVDSDSEAADVDVVATPARHRDAKLGKNGNRSSAATSLPTVRERPSNRAPSRASGGTPSKSTGVKVSSSGSARKEVSASPTLTKAKGKEASVTVKSETNNRRQAPSPAKPTKTMHVLVPSPAKSDKGKGKGKQAGSPSKTMAGVDVGGSSKTVKTDKGKGKVVDSPSKSGASKDNRRGPLSIKEQGALSPHKLNASTATCQVISADVVDEFLATTYRDLYPLTPVSISSGAGVNVHMTPFSWLFDGTYGDKPINVDLIKDVVTFAECGKLRFINPARFPPSRLAATPTRSSSNSKTTTFNLVTKGLSMGPVCCITFGTVSDSHMFHPRLARTSATHGITILPFKGEWERALACLGNTFGESMFSHFIYANGVSFQGAWSTPTKEQEARWEAEQSGEPLPLYVPPKHQPDVASIRPESRGPGQAESSVRGLVGQGGPMVGYGGTIPVFDCTRFFQPRRGEFARMRSLVDFFAQAGEDGCPQIIGHELRKMSVVAVCYSANKWRHDEGNSVNWNLGLNVRGVYLLVNGPKE